MIGSDPFCAFCSPSFDKLGDAMFFCSLGHLFNVCHIEFVCIDVPSCDSAQVLETDTFHGIY